MNATGRIVSGLLVLGALGSATVAVASASEAKPAASDYAFMCTTPAGSPCHWDSSHTITVSGAGIDSAVSQVAQATGLTMQVVSGPADITVTAGSALATERAGEATLHHSDAGIINSASIVVSEQTPAALVHETLIHELGHAVGLDHAAGANEVMSAVLTGQNDYQAGDLAGLRAVGTLGR